MYDPDNHSVIKENTFTLTLTTPISEGDEEYKDYEGDMFTLTLTTPVSESEIKYRDYDLLEHKPQINGETLVGNKLLADLFPDGIIINGGNCTGYDEPIVPPEVSYTGEVGF